MVRKEIETIPAVRLHKSSKTRLEFPVFLGKRKDGALRFCMEYRALSKGMWVDKCLLPKI